MPTRASFGHFLKMMIPGPLQYFSEKRPSVGHQFQIQVVKYDAESPFRFGLTK